MRDALKEAERVVIKLGTNVAVANGRFNYGALGNIVYQIVESDKEIAIVSSGAVEIGNAHYGFEKNSDTLKKRIAAGYGQQELISGYRTCFDFLRYSITPILPPTYIKNE